MKLHTIVEGEFFFFFFLLLCLSRAGGGPRAILETGSGWRWKMSKEKITADVQQKYINSLNYIIQEQIIKKQLRVVLLL